MDRFKKARWLIVGLIILLVVVGFVFLNYAQQGPMRMDSRRLCDLDHDGDCDGEDQQIFDDALGTCRGDAGYNFDADVDGDGCVVSTDFFYSMLNLIDFSGLSRGRWLQF